MQLTLYSLNKLNVFLKPYAIFFKTNFIFKNSFRFNEKLLRDNTKFLYPPLILFPLLSTSYINMGFPDISVGKESTCNVGDLGSILGLGRSLAEGKGYPLQYSGLENSMGCIVHGASKSGTRLSDFHLY